MNEGFTFIELLNMSAEEQSIYHYQHDDGLFYSYEENDEEYLRLED